MEQKIITSSTASGLNELIAKAILEGFTCVGSHKVVEVNHEHIRANTRVIIRVEYSQSVKK